MILKCIIAEDEAVAARRMQKLLEDNGLEVVSVCKSVKDLLKSTNELGEPDIYFFDIHLSDGLIFNIFEKITLESPVIFTTAFDQYAIKAFKQNSIDYLLKPIDKRELRSAIEKFKKHHSPVNSPDLEALSKLLNQAKSKSHKERISVKVGDRLKTINTKDICLFYSKEKINFLHNADNRSYPIDFSLDELQNALDPESFYRINRSVIVNVNFIKEVISYTNSRLKIQIENADFDDLVVARDRVKSFKEWLG